MGLKTGKWGLKSVFYAVPSPKIGVFDEMTASATVIPKPQSGPCLGVSADKNSRWGGRIGIFESPDESGLNDSNSAHGVNFGAPPAKVPAFRFLRRLGFHGGLCGPERSRASGNFKFLYFGAGLLQFTRKKINKIIPGQISPRFTIPKRNQSPGFVIGDSIFVFANGDVQIVNHDVRFWETELLTTPELLSACRTVHCIVRHNTVGEHTHIQVWCRLLYDASKS